MKKIIQNLFILLLATVASFNSYAQNSVGIGTNTPNPNAVLELVSTDQGLLVPRLTNAQIGAMTVAVADEGLLVYDATNLEFIYWDGSSWEPLGGADTDWEIVGDTVFNELDWVVIGGDQTAADVFAQLTVNTERGTGVTVSSYGLNTENVGLDAEAAAGSDFNIGLSGSAYGNSSDTTIGVYAEAIDVEVVGGAIRGEAYQAVGDNGGDVFGASFEVIGDGVNGNLQGVSGTAVDNSGTGNTFGIYGNASGGLNNYAGYFEQGNVYVENFLGINVPVPAYELDVAGTALVDTLRVSFSPGPNYHLVDIDGTGKLTWQPLGSDTDWEIGAGTVYNQNDFIGIGTNAPITALQLASYMHLDTIDAGGEKYTMLSNNLTFNGSDFQYSNAGMGIVNYMGGGRFGVEIYEAGLAGGNSGGNPVAEFTIDSNRAQIETKGINSTGLEIRSNSNVALLIENQRDNNKPSALRFRDERTGQEVGLMSPDSLGNAYDLRLPDNLPTASGMLMTSDPGGNLYWTNPSGSISSISDADGDTYIDVEGSGDDDVIHFNTGGATSIEFFRMDSGRFEVLNTGHSVFIGEGAGALDNLSSNNYNTAIGDFAFNKNTSGQINTAVGGDALRFNTTGQRNVALGSSALLLNTTGSRNTAVGTDALFLTETQTGNTAVGDEALYGNIGDYNTSIGFHAGYGALTTTGNSYLGAFTEGGGTGNYNAYMGYQAGQSSTGSYNVFSGYRAGQSNTGSYNVSLGQLAGVDNQGTGGIHIGRNAGNSNTTGNYNINLGYYTGDARETGNDNINLGRYAGRYGDDGSHGIHMGYYAGRYDSASYNIAIGYFAGSSTTTGTQNVMIGGNSTGSSNVSGSYNVYVGALAGQLANSNFNTAIGYYAIRNSTGTRNTALGYQAGDVNTLGSNNTYVGYGADPASNNLSNATAIGYNAVVQASNTVQLGNAANVDFDGALMPDSDAGGAGEVLTSQGVNASPIWTSLPANTNVYNIDGSLTGARTVTHGANTLTFNLTSTGSFRIQDNGVNAFHVQSDGDVNLDGGTMFVDASINRVGIGTTTPQNYLHIDKPSTGTAYMQVTNTTTGSGTTDGCLFGTNGSSMLVWNYEATNMLFGTGGTTKMVIESGGDVGIGITNPSYKLDVNGGFREEGGYWNVDEFVASSQDVFFTNTNAHVLIGANQTAVNKLGVEGSVAIGANYSGTTVGPTNGLIVEGNVGIGDATPLSTAALHIYQDGTTGAYGVYSEVNSTYGTTSYAGFFLNNNSSTSQNIGIQGRANAATTANTRGGRFYSYGTGSTSYGVYAYTNNAASTNYGLYSSGSVFTTGSFLPSDAKLKSNIVEYDNAISKIQAIQVKSYEYRQDGIYKYMNLPQGPQVGLIAGNLKSVLPSLTKKTIFDSEDIPDYEGEKEMIEFDAVNYAGLVPVTVKAIQEQQIEIDELKKRIAELEKLILSK